MKKKKKKKKKKKEIAHKPMFFVTVIGFHRKVKLGKKEFNGSQTIAMKRLAFAADISVIFHHLSHRFDIFIIIIIDPTLL